LGASSWRPDISERESVAGIGLFLVTCWVEHVAYDTPLFPIPFSKANGVLSRTLGDKFSLVTGFSGGMVGPQVSKMDGITVYSV
jgi:hypothetical protein